MQLRLSLHLQMDPPHRSGGGARPQKRHPDGRLKSLTDPEGVKTDYQWDPAGRLQLILFPGNTALSYSDYRDTVPGGLQTPGGLAATLVYDGYNRLTGKTLKTPNGQTLATRSTTWDALDRLTSKQTTQNGAPTSTESYTYDPYGRLKEVKQGTTLTESYTYDAADNRLTDSKTTGLWQYNTANQLTQYGEGNQLTTLTYNQNGDRTGKTVNPSASSGQVPLIQQYIYDITGNLIEVQDGQGTPIASYGHDPFGRRLWKEVTTNGNTTTRTYFHWSGDLLTGEYDGQGHWQQSYGYTGLDAGAELAWLRTSTGYAFAHNDHLGTPELLTDFTGKIVWQASHEAYGKTTVAQTSSITNNIRFPGQYEDAETHLHYNRHRTYDPETGRYLQNDPIGLEGGFNRYGYVGGSPLTRTDPTGEFALGAQVVVVVGAGLIIMSSPQGQKAIGGAISGTINAVKQACKCPTYRDVYDPGREDKPKHGKEPRQSAKGIVGAEPTNPSIALAISVATGKGRIGFDPTTGEIVLFQLQRTDEEKCERYWHGYVVNFDDLTPRQWKDGRDAGWPTKWPRKPK